MEAQARVLVLVERGAVEAAEAVHVGREVPRHPVQDDADAGLMRLVDEMREVGRVALAAGRREQADRLVAPGALERELADRQQLHVREAHLRDVGDQRGRELAPAQLAVALLRHAPPGADVDLVDAHRLGARVAGLALAQPRLVGEAVLDQAVHDRGRRRRPLAGEGERVGLERQDLARRAQKLELVERPRPHVGEEDLPHTALDALPHRVAPAVPVRLALGAQTPKNVPGTPSTVIGWAPSFS